MVRFSLSLRHVLAPVLVSGALVLGLGGCEPQDCCGMPEPELKQELVANFADRVVVPTYQRLASRLTELDAAVQALRADPTEARLRTAREAWLAARVPWTQSEAFRSGPVDTGGHAQAMDGWPVDREALAAALSSGDAFTAEFVRGQEATRKGFHAVEYLLFGEGGTKKAADFTPRQLEHLTATSAELLSVSSALTLAWTQATDGRPSHRETLATAGQSGNTAYPSIDAAAKEMVEDLIHLLDEVAEEKLSRPYDAKNPALVENPFAGSEPRDLANNMRGVENVYLGRADDLSARGQTLRDVVGANTDVDVRIRGALTQAIATLDSLPTPFRDAVLDPAAADEIEAARSAVRTLRATFQSNVLPLVTR